MVDLNQAFLVRSMYRLLKSFIDLLLTKLLFNISYDPHDPFYIFIELFSFL